MPAVLFGSIGTIADTSELQRAAFNEAFREHGLAWEWSQDEYRELLTSSGGAQRIADYAEQRGDTVDAGAVHATKSARYQQKLRDAAPAPRPGVADTVKAARDRGAKLALVTTTSVENISALTEAMRPALDLSEFDLVLDTSSVSQPKPDPEVYRLALERLGEDPDDCVAIEDNVGGAQSAAAAGIRVVAFPGENNAAHTFDGAAQRVEELSFADLPAVDAHA